MFRNSRSGVRRTLLALLTAMLVGVGLVVGAPVARADDTAETVVYEASIANDGVLTVNETITFGEGGTPATVTQRLATTAPAPDNATYHYEISDIKANAEGADLGATVESDGDYQVVTVDTAKAEGKPITISYKVKGATHETTVASGQQARTTIAWRFLQGLSVGATEVSGTLEVPSMVSQIECLAGPPVAPVVCSMAQAGTHDAPQPTFSDGPRGPGEVVILTVQTDAASVSSTESVTHNWSLDRAFSLSPLSLLLTLGSLLLGGAVLWLMHRRAGRDVAAINHPTRIAEFSPVGEGEEEFLLLEQVRPGHIGTVADERVDPVDVTGTLLDLAVRGHLRIHELPRESEHHPLDWDFERLEGGKGELRPHEVLLRDAVAPADGEPVRVSNISNAISGVIPEVQSKLYDDVVSLGWFDKRPDDARNNWTLFGWVALTLAVVVTGLLVAFTTLGLWGLALIALALGLVFVAQEMPRRSSKGSELLAGLHVLATELQHHRTDQMPKGREYSELSEILPYAVVLGGSKRWLDAIVAEDDDEHADGTDLPWYHAPSTWHLHHLPVSMDAFITSVEGHLFGR
ncbi:DUF2207 family protein [Aestuariimicrobium ganziense]|uniref:DUF2207 family protein n=1 Tax=Aestuariimicrobium ganziense TaxID=2773677 RepID=UPI00194144A4|nr:DUF2207 domain-containing protein [Aestuariimicrobium ganziense]